MQTTSLRRIFLIAGILSLLVSYLGIWFRFIDDPVERTGSDFIAFYSAGRVAQSEGIARTYEVLLQQQVQEDEVGFSLVEGQVLLYNHLPFLIPILQMIVSQSYVASFYRWVFILITLYAAGILVLSRMLKQTGIDRGSSLLAAAGAILFLPVFFSLMNGQDTAFVFLGAAIWMFGLISGKEYISGLGLSLTTVRPHIAVFLAIPMLFRYRRVFAGFVLGSGLLAVFSVLILGVEGTGEFINTILLTAGGEWYGIKENAMYNLIGLLTRAVPQLGAGTIRTLGWIVYGIALAGLCVLWWKTRDLRNSLIGLSVTLALFVVPHLHFHDLALLLVPIYELIWLSRESGNLKTSIATGIPIAISLLLLVSNISPYLQYTTPYLILLALVLYPYYRKRTAALTTPHRS